MRTNFQTDMKATIINELMARLSELRREKETLMGRIHHFTINYTGWLGSEDGIKALSEFNRLSDLDKHFSMVILDLRNAK